MIDLKKEDVDEKIAELLDAHFNDDEYFGEAILYALPFVRKLILAVQEKDMSKIQFQYGLLNVMIQSKFSTQKDFQAEAEKALIAEAGTVIRTDVDNFKFVPHDTRY